MLVAVSSVEARGDSTGAVLGLVATCLLLFLLLKPVEIPQVQFWMRLSSCPLRADSFGATCAENCGCSTVAVLGQGCGMPVVVQR